MFLVKKSSGFFLFIVTFLFHTDAVAHAHAHTHTQTHTDQCLYFGLLVVQTGCYTIRPSERRELLSSCSTFRASMVDKSLKPKGRTCTHCLFIIIYKSAKHMTSSLPLPGSGTSTRLLSRGSGWSWGLVDPRQLLHNLNDFVHCGFTLHAAAVIDLKHKDTKL